ncbi:MAG: hypothetical protein KAR00_02225 [Candidatus Pacebacteria bacterium]|nr:hypothetical protein [Candidatus Paceibacterota bacterium]
MKKVDIKKAVGIHFRKRLCHYEHNIFAPCRDWAIIFVVFSFFIISITVFNFHIFYQVDKGKRFFIDLALMKAETINRTTLRNIIDVFDTRANKFSDLKSNKPLNPDPTL